MKLRKRSHFHNIKVQSEAAIADVEAIANYPEDLAKIISVDKTVFFGRRHPFVAREEKSMTSLQRAS